ncbi:MAG: BolA/IbaG family iron-sulfur metabolism protein [Gammaproteobacteria bacterium]|nr:BolA/IbaG family iron-sulfur metabolism protein [Gammaproteobacteria bacterium]
MSLEQRIEEALVAGFAGAEVSLELSGNKALIEVVSEIFSGKSRVERSKLVYQAIDGFIRTGELHAVTIRAQTPAEHG